VAYISRGSGRVFMKILSKTCPWNVLSHFGSNPDPESVSGHRLRIQTIFSFADVCSPDCCCCWKAPGAPVNCLPLVLQLEKIDSVKLDSVFWSAEGAVMTFSCAHGTYFAEGGTSRTLVCVDGVWPTVVPRCTGLVSCVLPLQHPM